MLRKTNLETILIVSNILKADNTHELVNYSIVFVFYNKYMICNILYLLIWNIYFCNYMIIFN